MTVEPFGLSPEEAVRWFREKGYAITDDWRDQWSKAHARAFTVARVSRLDLLADIRVAVDSALANGDTLREFTNGLRPTLQQKGWWGQREETDPETGETRVVQLGSPRRLRTIFQTNLNQAEAAGRWERMQRTKARRPYGRYVAILDGRTRPQHETWHGTVLPLDHPWWSTHAPPNGWGCRCSIQQLSERDLERYGYEINKRAPPRIMRDWVNERTGETLRIPRGIDPGFDYNPGAVPRGYEPGAPAEPLRNSQTYQDLGLPTAKAMQATAPEAPPLWDREYSAADRAETDRRFRELFGITDNETSSAITDVQGEQLLVDMRFLDHLRGAHKPAGEAPDPRRVEFLPLVRDTVERPHEIWLVPMRLERGANAGRVVLRKRYIGIYRNHQNMIVAHRDERGYLAWTATPSRNLNSQRRGYLAYQAGEE